MLDDHIITTSLVHPRDRGEISWWQTTVICDVPGVHDNASLHSLSGVLEALGQAGFETILIRPADPEVEQSLSFLPEFIERAHQVGLKVLVRAYLLPEHHQLTGPASPPLVMLSKDISALTARIRAVLSAGADGVDLGTIAVRTADGQPLDEDATFNHAVNVALAELAAFDGDAILTAALPAHPPETFVNHLEENWFHHLRSSAMLEVEWSPESIRKTVTDMFTTRDSLGLSTPWRHVLQKPANSPAARGSESVGWARGAPEKRYNAMNLLVAALPGSAYMPFLNVGGSVYYPPSVDAPTEITYAATPETRELADHIATALHVRHSEGLATSPLAFIDGLSWAGSNVLVMLVGSVVVVLNTSEETVVVPRKYQMLACSGDAGTVAGGGTAIPPNTCSWFRPADIVPTDPAQYDRR